MIHLQTSADKDWNEDVLVVLDSLLALALSLAMECEVKWNILSLRGCDSNLLMNSS